ncbi:MAG: sulfatase-like hydrolase/transferase, partial [Lentisphaeria bacterium]|nr:sulfatase-like hydrolase/transferase [Lentisphaeria bacterium]
MSRSVPHLVFVMCDHQRADSLGMMQAGVEVAPALNGLAARGTAFTRAYSTCPLCVPARTALATGRYPTATGVITNDWRGDSARDCTPIHQLLYEAGWEVAHIGVHHVRVRPELRERVPFALWVDQADHREYLEERGVVEDKAALSAFRRPVRERHGDVFEVKPYSNTRTAVWPHPAESFLDRYWCRRAAEFVRAKHDRPFALFLYLWAPHPPLRVPEPYASMFDPERLELPANVGVPSPGEPAGRRLGIAAQLAEGVSDAEWRRVWAAHLGLVRLAHDGIGEVLRAVDESGLGDDTLTVFTVDHGEHLGQHGMYQKMEMYEQALRIPLVLAGPQIRTQRVDQPVSHLDVLPTLLELLGLAGMPEADGRSLVPCLREGIPPSPRPVFAQYSGNPAAGDMRRCILRERWKAVFDPRDTAELYDLEADPLEMENLAADPKWKTLLAEL